MLAKHVAQMFYVPDTTNKILKMVIPRKRRIIRVENAVDEKEAGKYPKLLMTMTHANPKIEMGKPMLTVGILKETSKSCVVLHNYYINNYKKCQHIIGGFKEKHFLVGEAIFLISWSNFYDLFTLNVLDISLMRCIAL
jgi:hypothetical protein